MDKSSAVQTRDHGAQNGDQRRGSEGHNCVEATEDGNSRRTSYEERCEVGGSSPPGAFAKRSAQTTQNLYAVPAFDQLCGKIRGVLRRGRHVRIEGLIQQKDVHFEAVEQALAWGCPLG